MFEKARRKRGRKRDEFNDKEIDEERGWRKELTKVICKGFVSNVCEDQKVE